MNIRIRIAFLTSRERARERAELERETEAVVMVGGIPKPLRHSFRQAPNRDRNQKRGVGR